MNRYSTNRAYNEAMGKYINRFLFSFFIGLLFLVVGYVFLTEQNEQNKSLFYLQEKVDYSFWYTAFFIIGAILIVFGLYKIFVCSNVAKFANAHLKTSYLVLDENIIHGIGLASIGGSVHFEIPYEEIDCYYAKEIDIKEEDFTTMKISTKERTYYLAIDNAYDAVYRIGKIIEERNQLIKDGKI